MLEAIRVLDPNSWTISSYTTSLALEMLNRSLWDLIKEGIWMLLSLNTVCPFTHELLVTFEALMETDDFVLALTARSC